MAGAATTTDGGCSESAPGGVWGEWVTMPKRKGLSKKTRFDVFKRDSFTCQYCGKSAPDVLLHADHIVPVCEGGTNEILNLITACAECNLGKGGTALADDSTAKKQLKQIKELSDRREQLRMIAEWRDGLQSLDNEALTLCESHLSEHYDINLSEFGRNDLRKTVKKYGLAAAIEAIGKSANAYLDDPESKEDREKFLNYIPRICYWQERQKTHPEEAEFAKMCGYASKRWHTCYRPNLQTSLSRYHKENGAPLDILWDAVRSSSGIMKFHDYMNGFLAERTDG